MIYPAESLARWIDSCRDRKVVVLGAARTGLAAAKLLQSLGARPVVSDKGPVAEAIRDDFAAAGIPCESGGHSPQLLDDAAMVVPSPGIPMDAPILLQARERGIPLIGEIELAYRVSRAPMIAITGSNGKTTTTTLIDTLLKSQGWKVGCGGNIGKALTTLAAEDWELLVAEISTFQLETCHDLAPATAVLLNLYDNHLDRHGSRDVYFGLKAQLFGAQGPEDRAVYNADQPEVVQRLATAPGKHFPFSRTQALDTGIWIENGYIVASHQGDIVRIMPVAQVPLPGDHNLENVLAALAAVWPHVRDLRALIAAVSTFQGVHHRIEAVRQRQERAWFNDSKATNYEAARRALISFSRPVVWIGGGRDKGGDFAPLADAVSRHARHAVLVGEAATSFAERLTAAGYPGITVVGTLKEAVEAADRISQPGDVVLFSPACTSFDQFRDYEERGDVFKSIVNAL
jgi:UDP-N-acetylmuramoylalanine--D-glutamate ligase